MLLIITIIKLKVLLASLLAPSGRAVESILCHRSCFCLKNVAAIARWANDVQPQHEVSASAAPGYSMVFGGQFENLRAGALNGRGTSSAGTGFPAAVFCLWRYRPSVIDCAECANGVRSDELLYPQGNVWQLTTKV